MRGIILALVAALVAATLWPAAGNAGQQGPRWERLIGSSTFDSAGGIARAPDGSLYVAGTMGGKRFAGAVKPGGKDIALLKLSPRGAVAWVRFLGGTGDAGDESFASLVRDVREAEVVRDVGEVRDIIAAEERLQAGRYGVCIDCGDSIGYDRLAAYPTAKRCLACQQHRERTRAPSKYTGR